jgi:hypothetical protein
MYDDPILMTLVAISLIVIPTASYFLGKIRIRYVFFLPVLAMLISFPLFLFLVVAQGGTYKALVYITFSLWIGGFFGFFISLIFYKRYTAKIKK